MKVVLVGLSVGLGITAAALANAGHPNAALVALFFAVAMLPVNDSVLIAAIVVDVLDD